MDLEKFYDKAYAWLLTIGPRIIIAVIVIIIGQWLIRLFSKRVRKVMAKKAMESSLLPFIISLLSTILQVVLILAVMQILGIKLTVFTAVVGAFGVAAGFALSGTLQNFTSGILILLMKPYRVGDNIIAQGQEGSVVSIQIFYTVVTTYDNKTVIIPNSKLSNEVIINISREGKRRLDVELKFSFANDFEQIKKLIAASITNMPGILKEPEFRIGVSTLEPDGYRIMINTWVNSHGFQDAKFAFQEKLMSDLKANGLKLPGM